MTLIPPRIQREAEKAVVMHEKIVALLKMDAAMSAATKLAALGLAVSDILESESDPELQKAAIAVHRQMIKRSTK